MNTKYSECRLVKPASNHVLSIGEGEACVKQIDNRVGEEYKRAGYQASPEDIRSSSALRRNAMLPFHTIASPRIDTRQFACTRRMQLIVPPKHHRALSSTELYRKVTENKRSFYKPETSCQSLLPRTPYEVALFKLEQPATYRECLDFMHALHGIFIGWHGLLLVSQCLPTLFPDAVRVFALQMPWAEHGRTDVLSLRHTAAGAWEQYPMIVAEGNIPAGFCLMVVTRGKS